MSNIQHAKDNWLNFVGDYGSKHYSLTRTKVQIHLLTHTHTHTHYKHHKRTFFLTFISTFEQAKEKKHKTDRGNMKQEVTKYKESC